VKWLLIAALAALLLAGCTTVPAPSPLAARVDFAADGRLAARGELAGRTVNENVHFRWRRSGDQVTVELGSPLGDTQARLQVTPAEATLRMADGRSAKAPDADALLAELTGLALPVAQLRWWIEGTAAPQSPATELPGETPGSRRLEQAGWQVSLYEAAPYPRRLVLKRDDFEVRIAVTAWP